MSVQWEEVDAAEFENYPTRSKQKAPDELDDVMAALQSGRTVQLTLNDERAVRGRRMALGRRAKQRGFPIEMRYQDNKIIVRRAAEGGAQAVPADEAPGHDREQVPAAESGGGSRSKGARGRRRAADDAMTA